MRYHTTRQAAASDWGKHARTRSSVPWGGRRKDGNRDSKKPPSFFTFLKKSSSSPPVYGYRTEDRKKWASYGKRYEPKKKS